MKHHDTPPANLASLRARVTNAAAAESLPMGRVQRYVGVAVTVEILGTLTDDAGRGGTCPGVTRGCRKGRWTDTGQLRNTASIFDDHETPDRASPFQDRNQHAVVSGSHRPERRPQSPTRGASTVLRNVLYPGNFWNREIGRLFRVIQPSGGPGHLPTSSGG